MESLNRTEKVLLAVACFLVAGIVTLNALSSPVSPLLSVVYTNRETAAGEGASSDYYAALASKEENLASGAENVAASHEDLWEDPSSGAVDSRTETSEAAQPSSEAASQAESKPSSGTSSSSKTPAVVNINTASASQLAASLPGIGEVKAAAIVSYRNANGPFRSVDELINVKGIGEATLEKLRPYATVG